MNYVLQYTLNNAVQYYLTSLLSRHRPSTLSIEKIQDIFFIRNTRCMASGTLYSFGAANFIKYLTSDEQS